MFFKLPDELKSAIDEAEADMVSIKAMTDAAKANDNLLKIDFIPSYFIKCIIHYIIISDFLLFTIFLFRNIFQITITIQVKSRPNPRRHPGIVAIHSASE